MEPVVTAAAHVDDAARPVAVSAVAAAETTAAEAATPEATTLVPTTEAALVSATKPATTGMAPTKAAARVTAPEASASEVSPAKTASAEVPAATTGMAAEGGRVGHREHADRDRDGGGSEHGFECLADHHALQCIAKRRVRFGD